MRHLAFCALLAASALVATAAGAASRGPATPEEREKLVTLVAQLEAEPRGATAAESRQWVLDFLKEVPDITAKQCLSLFGGPAERQGMPEELAMQQLYSNAAYVVKHNVPAGTTEALLASLQGTLRAYEGMKKADPAFQHPTFEGLLQMERDGQLEVHVRTWGRNCR